MAPTTSYTHRVARTKRRKPNNGAIGGRSLVCLRSVHAGGVIGDRSLVRLRSVHAPGVRPRGLDDDAGAVVRFESGRRDAEVPCTRVAAHPGGEQFGGLVGHLGVDDGAPAPP